MKLEGVFGDEDMAGSMKAKEGWLMVLPEFEGQNIRASEMLKWLIGMRTFGAPPHGVDDGSDRNP